MDLGFYFILCPSTAILVASCSFRGGHHQTPRLLVWATARLTFLHFFASFRHLLRPCQSRWDCCQDEWSKSRASEKRLVLFPESPHCHLQRHLPATHRHRSTRLGLGRFLLFLAGLWNCALTWGLLHCQERSELLEPGSLVIGPSSVSKERFQSRGPVSPLSCRTSSTSSSKPLDSKDQFFVSRHLPTGPLWVTSKEQYLTGFHPRVKPESTAQVPVSPCPALCTNGVPTNRDIGGECKRDLPADPGVNCFRSNRNHFVTSSCPYEERRWAFVSTSSKCNPARGSPGSCRRASLFDLWRSHVCIAPRKRSARSCVRSARSGDRGCRSFNTRHADSLSGRSRGWGGDLWRRSSFFAGGRCLDGGSAGMDYNRSGTRNKLLLSGGGSPKWSRCGATSRDRDAKGSTSSAKAKAAHYGYFGRKDRRARRSSTSVVKSGDGIAEGARGASGPSSTSGNCSPNEGQPDACFEQAPELRKDDGEPSKDKGSHGASYDPRKSSDARYYVSLRWRGDRGRHASWQCSSPCSAATIKGTDIFGIATSARRRSTSRWTGIRVFLQSGLSRCSRKGKAAARFGKSFRWVLPVRLPECHEASKAGLKSSSNDRCCPGYGCVNGHLLGKIWRLWSFKGVGNDPIQSCSCVRLRPPRRLGRSTRACCPLDDGSGASGPGQQQMGPGLPAHLVGRASNSALVIQTVDDTVEAKGICALMPAEVGDSGSGLCQGSGLHPISEERGHEAKAAEPGPSAKTKAQKEAKVPGQRWRKPKQQDRWRGVAEAKDGDPSPSSSMSARPGPTRTVNFGRGEPSEADATERPIDDDPRASKEFRFDKIFPEHVKGDGVPIAAWVDIQVRRLLASRTSFSLYLLRSINLCREGRDDILSTALFPIPIPFDSVWSGDLEKANGSARQLRARRKLLHVAIMALNFLHDRAPLMSLRLLRRRPGSHHLQVYERLSVLIKACVLSNVATVARCGRKSFQLDARLQELYGVLVQNGLTEKSKYHQSSSGAPVPLQNESAEELRPYRQLQADRLKITGQGQWDCRNLLNNLLYMPFLEPRFNQFDIQPPAHLCPDVKKEDPGEVLRLAKVWDARRLLRLIPEEMTPSDPLLFSRVFNNYKSETVDRQIGDRRGQNFTEGRIVEGPSHSLPTGVSLMQIMPKRFQESLQAYVTDRRDFYHQFTTTWERASTNVVFPLLPLTSLQGTRAYDDFIERFGRRRKVDREAEGDYLHGQRRNILVGDDTKVAAAFAAIFQGDHLGVEIACNAHENLLAEYGLLHPHCRLLSDQAIIRDDASHGLVIDDFFVIEKNPLGRVVRDGLGAAAMRLAKRAYSDNDIYGSDDKDVWGENHFKVVGAEVDSRDEVVKAGAVICGAPASKRLALASVAAMSSSLAYTSDSLHSSLVGSLVSMMMFRRPMMAILNHVFQVVPNDLFDPNNPELRPLPRAAAEELALCAALAPLMCSNLAVPVLDKVFATDASNAKGGIVSASVDEEVSKLLWRSADKKGGNVPLLSRNQIILHCYDVDYEQLSGPEWNYDEEKVQRPIGMKFDFVEAYGGAGVVTHWLSELRIVCAPVLDISFSPHYNMADGKVISWINFMLESKRLRAVLLAPPCTTFSPAAWPSLRSYANPLGHDRTNLRVLNGNLLAGSGMSVLLTCKRTHSFGVLETTRRSKMRWLPAWQRLLQIGAEETHLASCAFGSIHQKEFCLLSVNMILDYLRRPCTRDHPHVKREGKFTKPSATYCEGLAKAMAEVFEWRIKKGYEAEEIQDLSLDGLEDPLSNDIALSSEWTIEDDWAWRGKSHINLLETATTLRLQRRLAKEGGDCRATYLGDSHVSRSSLARGRTSSRALRPMLRQSAAISTAYGIYLAGRFTPTRMMPADGPSRDTEIPPPVPHSIIENVFQVSGLPGLRWLSGLPRTKRWSSNWIRLVLLLHPHLPAFHVSSESSRIYPASYSPDPTQFFQFDSSLGFPGEGPGFGFALTLLASCHTLPSSRTSILLLGNLAGVAAAVGRVPVGASHGDRVRQAARSGIELGDGRRTTELTAATRIDLLERFKAWLQESGKSFEQTFLANPPDLDDINKVLCDFGKWLFKSGKPYYHYSETINSVSARRPVLRRSLQQAWDLAFMWGSFEPTEHHVAMPHQVLLAILSVMMVWGWQREAACIALSWGALLRIGEVYQAKRRDLVLPSDVAGSNDYALIRISEPKTRYRAARHQSGKVEQPDLLMVIDIGFKGIGKDEPLWPFSGSTLRNRLNRVLLSLGLPHRPGQKPKPLGLSSLRGGGATWLITASESAEMVRRRGRWASMRSMEIYLQEIAAATYLNELDESVKTKVLEAMDVFPEVLQVAWKFQAAKFPSATWPWFFRHGTF